MPGPIYRITYSDATVLTEIAADAAERTAVAPRFARAVVADAELAARIATAHAAVERGGPTLATDVALHAVYALALARHAESGQAVAEALARPAPAGGVAVRRALAYLDAHFADGVDWNGWGR